MSRVPTILTASRLAAAPFLAALLLWAERVSFADPAAAAPILWAAFALFALAALTDLADGWLARRLDAVSPFGAALDHAADKTLVAAGLIAYAIAWAPFDLIAAGLVIVLRDLAVAGLREGLSLSGRPLPVGGFGKLKTVIEMAGLAAALASLPLGLTPNANAGAPALLLSSLEAVARAGLWAAAGLALASLAIYLASALRPADAPPRP